MEIAVMHWTVRSVGALALAVALCGMVGCQSPKDKALTSAHYSAVQLRQQLVEAQPQIDRTMSSLDYLMRAQSDNDVKSALSVFSADVDELSSRAAGVRVEADAMEREGATYFRDWDRELVAKGTPDRREGAAARGQMSDEYKQVHTYMQNLRQRYRKLALDLADIRDKVRAHPTSATTKSMAELVRDAERQALDVQQSADVLVTAIDNIAK